MKLSNFEEFVSPTILERGRKYYKNGRVAKLSGEDGVYSALVDGTECYDVNVEVDDSGKITEHNCTCPYDMDNICKHKVAVFYSIRDGGQQYIASEKRSTPTKKEKAIKEPPLKELLSKLSREELEQIILSQAESDKTFHAELTHRYSPVAGNLKAARKLIMSFIIRNKRQGFIEYGRVGDALEGADMVITDAGALCDSGEYIKALELYLMTNAIVTGVAGYSDDDGDIAPRLEQCMAGVALIVSGINETSDKRLWRTCFDKIASESRNPVYNGWDYGLDLLDCCIGFCEDKEFSDELRLILEELAQGLKKDTASFYSDRINRIKHRILCKADEKAAEKFEEANIANNHFRRLAIERNIAKEYYTKALKYCEGLGFGGSCDYVLSIYKATGQIENYRKTLLEAVCTHRIKPYFYELKDAYDDDEWTTLLPSVLDAIEQAKRNTDHDYRELLIKYCFFDRLLNCVKNNTSLIADYCKELNADYPDEVKTIFEQYLTQKFASANNRSHYVDCCRLMRVYKKACGGEVMRQLRDKMLELYPRKPALIEELRKLD
jgi:hypothetical protein